MLDSLALQERNINIRMLTTVLSSQANQKVIGIALRAGTELNCIDRSPAVHASNLAKLRFRQLRLVRIGEKEYDVWSHSDRL